MQISYYVQARILPAVVSRQAQDDKRLLGVIVIIERLQELQRDNELEPNPNKKRDILEQILALVRVGWEQLFSVLSKGENRHFALRFFALLLDHSCETGLPVNGSARLPSFCR